MHTTGLPDRLVRLRMVVGALVNMVGSIARRRVQKGSRFRTGSEKVQKGFKVQNGSENVQKGVQGSERFRKRFRKGFKVQNGQNGSEGFTLQRGVKLDDTSTHRKRTSGKTVLTDDGPLSIEVARRHFDPRPIGKNERRSSTGFDGKILALNARDDRAEDPGIPRGDHSPRFCEPAGPLLNLEPLELLNLSDP